MESLGLKYNHDTTGIDTPLTVVSMPGAPVPTTEPCQRASLTLLIPVGVVGVILVFIIGILIGRCSKNSKSMYMYTPTTLSCVISIQVTGKSLLLGDNSNILTRGNYYLRLFPPG